MKALWKYDTEPHQLGGPGTDYGCWFKSDNGQYICIQIGQCGNEPEGDKTAKAITDKMLAGLNSN